MPEYYDHGFTHEEISYCAFCIYEEEKRFGQYSGQDAHWFMAIERLRYLRSMAAILIDLERMSGSGRIDYDAFTAPPPFETFHGRRHMSMPYRFKFGDPGLFAEWADGQWALADRDWAAATAPRSASTLPEHAPKDSNAARFPRGETRCAGHWWSPRHRPSTTAAARLPPLRSPPRVLRPSLLERARQWHTRPCAPANAC